MFFSKKKNPQKHILRLGVEINLSALPEWIKSGEKDVPVVPYVDWGRAEYGRHKATKFEYLIFVLPVAEDQDWYFHKNAGEYSHSIEAIIELGDHFDPEIDIRGLCDGLSPDLEIGLWRGQINITFCRRLIMTAPLTEAVNIMSRGETSNGNRCKPRQKEIEVPTAFDDNGEPTKCMTVHERTEDFGAGYSNQLVHFWMDSPKGPIVMRDSTHRSH